MICRFILLTFQTLILIKLLALFLVSRVLLIQYIQDILLLLIIDYYLSIYYSYNLKVHIFQLCDNKFFTFFFVKKLFFIIFVFFHFLFFIFKKNYIYSKCKTYKVNIFKILKLSLLLSYFSKYLSYCVNSICELSATNNCHDNSVNLF